MQGIAGQSASFPFCEDDGMISSSKHFQKYKGWDDYEVLACMCEEEIMPYQSSKTK